MSIGGGNGEDKNVWHFERNSNYSVKSWYRIWRKQKDKEVNSQAKNSIRKSVMKLKVPLEIQKFIWKCISNARACKNLKRRSCVAGSPSPCRLCNKHEETVEHCLLFCENAKRVWFGCSLNYKPRDEDGLNFKIWWKKMVSESSERGGDGAGGFLEQLAVVCWLIWNERSKCIVEGAEWNPQDTVLKVHYLWKQYSRAASMQAI